LFEIQAEHMREHQQGRKPLSESHDAIWTLFGPADAICPTAASRNRANKIEATAGSFVKTSDPNVKLAQCFLRLANLPNFALDRLNRYEAALWRQVTQILFALDALDRRKPQERVRCSRFGARLEVHRPNS
jgi:hypothetical protein